MKFLRYRAFSLLLIGTVVLFTVSSCKKSSSGSSAGVSATISGTGWAATYPVTSFFFTAYDQFEIAAGQVKGGDSTGILIAFSGPFTLNRVLSSDSIPSLDIIYFDIKSGIEYEGTFGSGHSELTVTSYDSLNHKIAGTFTGVWYTLPTDSLVIKGGHFNVGFTAQ